MACREDPPDCVRKSQCHRLTVPINAGVKVELGETENVSQNRFHVHVAPLYPDPIRIRDFPARIGLKPRHESGCPQICRMRTCYERSAAKQIKFSF